MTVFSMLGSGATVIVNKKWDGEKYIQVLKEYKVFGAHGKEKRWGISGYGN